MVEVVVVVVVVVRGSSHRSRVHSQADKPRQTGVDSARDGPGTVLHTG